VRIDALAAIHPFGDMRSMKIRFRRVSAWAGLITVVVFAWATLRVIPSAHIRIAVGPVGGSFYQTAVQYRKLLKQRGYQVDIVPFDNTGEIGAQVSDRRQHLDLGFVAGNAAGAHGGELMSLGEIQLQPVFVFQSQRAAGIHPIHSVSDMIGMSVVLPPEQSVTSHVLLQIFALSGVTPRNTRIGFVPLEQGIAQLKRGGCDVGLFILGADSDWIADLARDPDLVMVPLAQQPALAKRLPYLTQVTLPAGVFDVEHNVPARDVPLLAATITVVARRDLPPASLYALLEAMREVHHASGYVNNQGEFPRYGGGAEPADGRVDDFYRSGTPWIFSHLPAWVASVIDAYLTPLLALWILLSALGTLVEIERVHRLVLTALARVLLWWLRLTARHGAAPSRAMRGVVARVERAIEHEDRGLTSLTTQLRDAIQVRQTVSSEAPRHATNRGESV
jgi:TRAP-type uncharacterized transport system substrate-binding protein